MRAIGALAAAALAMLLAGCMTGERVRFQAHGKQEALIRDGQSALVSRGRNSIILIRPARREFARNARPVFVVGIYNQARGPLNFRVADVSVIQTVGGQDVTLQVIPYEKLVQEERTRQVVAGMLVGAAAGANAMAAANSGYSDVRTTFHTPRGTFTANSTVYSPSAAAVARATAASQNEALISATIEQGQTNLAHLERAVIKDNTLLPGEWYGGQLHIAPLVASSSEPKMYTIALTVGSDRHELQVLQDAAQ
jgi:hypothetical protein